MAVHVPDLGRHPHPRELLASAGAVLIAGSIALGIVLASHGSAPATLDRPDFQLILDRLTSGRAAAAPGAAAVVIGPEGTWRGAAGVAEIATGRRVTADDYFRVASLTKTYTATLVLQLVERRKLSLSDTVAQRLPGVLGADKGAITIRQLLAHTSGLYDSMNDAVTAFAKDPQAFLATLSDPALRSRVAAAGKVLDANPDAVVSPKLWVDIADAEPLYSKPGTGYHYSNTNYILLGWIVEKLTGKPLGTAMRERIFTPLGLTHTAYDPNAALPDPHAHSYALPGRSDQTRITGGIAGASAVVATAEDVARFYSALLAGRLVSPRLLADAMLPEQMGIGAMPTACGAAYGHNGAWASYLAYARVDRAGTRAAVLLLNGEGKDSVLAGDSAAATLFCGAD